MHIEKLDVSSCPDFDHHEQVLWCDDEESGLKALIAIHDTRLGPALGGCRIYPYASRDEAIKDVLRLSRGMTFKSAVADLELGGGKSVIIADPRCGKHPDMLRAMGRFIDTLDGRYIAAEDSGTSVDDLRYMREHTDHVAGIVDKAGFDGGTRSGDPSPSTALGVHAGIKAALNHRFRSSDLAGVRVAIQGVGQVGYHLADYLARDGARVTVADVDRTRLDRVLQRVDAKVVDCAQILKADVDLIAPCAMGAVLSSGSIPGIRAGIVAGAANNQLASSADGVELHRRGILYAPDYVVNAGGVIDIAFEREQRGHMLTAHILRIGDTLTEIFYRATEEDLPTAEVAHAMALERLARAGKPVAVRANAASG